jgi:uncharacterized protein YjiS (DUF1127 family)
MREAASFIAGQSGVSEAGMLQTALHKLQETFEAWRNRRKIAVLTDFDDHLLADIGLTRQDVQDALDLPFSHDPGRELHLRVSRNRAPGWNI